MNFEPYSAVSSDLYNDLVYYFKYASSAYTAPCLRPNGNHLVIEVGVFLISSRTGSQNIVQVSFPTSSQTYNASSHEMIIGKR